MASNNRDEISRLELLHAAHPDGLVFPHLADAYRRAGRYAQAESVLSAGLSQHADFSSAHVVLGRLRLDQGKRAEAKSAFQRVLQLDADNPTALQFLGRLVADEGRVGEALTHLRRLARLKPSEELSTEIAKLELRAGELSPGRPTFGSSSAVEPGEVEESQEETASSWDREDAPLPPLPEPGEVVTETMAELYTRQGLYQRAEAVYRKLSERDPGNTRLKAKLQEATARRERDGGPAGAGVPERHPQTGRAGSHRAPPPERQSWSPADPGRAQPARGEAGASGRESSDPGIGSYLRSVVAWSDSLEPAFDEVPDRTVRDPVAPTRPRRRWPGASGSPGAHAPESPGPDSPMQSLIALTDILVGLLEYRDPFFRGSSSLTRLLATNVAEELGLGPSDTVDLALAAVLRDLGRLAMGGRLVDPPGSESAEARRKIERHVDLALQLMEGVNLPPKVMEAVRHHHERWDGAGYPAGLAGEEIPQLARILAVVDAYAAMVSPRSYRLPRKAADAAEELETAAGSQFDPEVVDALLRVLDRREQPHLGFVQRHRILLVNPDQPGAVVTAAKLCTAGYLAEVTVDPDTARERLRRAPVAALVVSAETGAEASDSLVREMRLDPLFATLPIVVMDAETVQLRVRLLESGADVCFPPGISHGELQGTVGALVRRTLRTREIRPSEDSDEAPWLALQGDIQDFPLSWLLQVMKYDSRTGGVGIRTATDQGAIYIEHGDVVHAQIRGGRSGEAALKEMLRWPKGRFTVQPEARTRERSINASIMHLLLTQAVEQDHAARGIFGAVSDEG
jgi:HD-GYP domain-containing protein (c-di-GMP phosphodiesterase class II)